MAFIAAERKLDDSETKAPHRRICRETSYQRRLAARRRPRGTSAQNSRNDVAEPGGSQHEASAPVDEKAQTGSDGERMRDGSGGNGLLTFRASIRR